MSDPPNFLRDLDEARALSGPHDRFVHAVRERFDVKVVFRGLEVWVDGPDERAVVHAERALAQMLAQIRSDGALTADDVDAILGPTAEPTATAGPRPASDASTVEGFQLRTPGQRRYVAAMREHDIVFSIGPAGTGKTFLAVLMAVEALKRGDAQRVVLCRPAVEAGESLGFLPGDYQAKVNPYMRPLYDALYSVLGFETVKRYMEREVVEVVPLAYMRGRTLNDAFIILDEAQNTTRAQMKMFLTRMGEHSRIVVTGDVTQVDLPHGVTSGLVHAQAILKRVQGIAFVELTVQDIVRHALVWKIIEAYDAAPAPRSDERARRGGRKRR